MSTLADVSEVTVVLRAGAVRDLIRRDGDTIARVAERVGISRDYMHKLLAGDRPCSFGMLVRLAAALRVEPTTIADLSAVAA